MAVNATLFPKLPVRELVPVSPYARIRLRSRFTLHFLHVTLKELIGLAKSRKRDSISVPTESVRPPSGRRLAATCFGPQVQPHPLQGAVNCDRRPSSGEVDIAFPSPSSRES